ncbi:MAG: galactokinase [Clostridia bacterium]|nr:galactokinase [Clostridia bacterium]
MTEIKKPYSDISDVFDLFPLLYGDVTEQQKNRYRALFDNFKKRFDCTGVYVASSSGRVEICGNHTDHNGGKVVSCAISLDSLAMFMPNSDKVIRIVSEGYGDIVVDLNGDEKEEKGSSASLVRGCVVALLKNGYKVGGFNAYMNSNVIGGAGISSSASFEVLIVEILNFLYNNGEITKEEKAVFAQYSDNLYVGQPCVLLDQPAIYFGGLKKLDFEDQDNKIKVSDVNNDLKDYTLILINTGGSHSDLTDEYASVPLEMFSVAKSMGKNRLVEISEQEFYTKLPTVIDKLNDRAISRAIHFYEENKRVDLLVDALNANDFETFLNCIKNSGISSLCKLQNCYVAGSKEQPIPKSLSIAEKYLCGGANRVHGGGFAGTILNIVKNDKKEAFIDAMRKYFSEENIIPLKVRSLGTIVL